jgi:hypothetical protein
MRRLSKRLGEAVSEQRLDASLIAEARRSMDRRMVAYEPALTLIELLLDGQGVSLEEEGSRVRLGVPLRYEPLFSGALVQISSGKLERSRGP